MLFDTFNCCFDLIHILYIKRDEFIQNLTQGMLKYREINFVHADIWRVFISGSSEAGKTYFARQLLENNLFHYERVYFYHPDIQEEFPVDWRNHLDKPILYEAGLPSEQDLLDLPPYSCVVLDDLFAQSCAVKHIDYLFRVLSAKKKIHVIIMTQHYFAEGHIGRSIRNSSNYHVLMTNVDQRINSRVAAFMNCKNDFKKAHELNNLKMYPYVFIDKTKYSRVTGIQIFTDILSKHKQGIYNSMPVYLISEPDFKNNFTNIGNGLAVKNGSDETKSKKRVNTACSSDLKKTKKKDLETDREEKHSGSDTSDFSDDEQIKPKQKQYKSDDTSDTDEEYQNYVRRRKFEKKVGNYIQRREIRAKLRRQNN